MSAGSIAGRVVRLVLVLRTQITNETEESTKGARWEDITKTMKAALSEGMTKSKFWVDDHLKREGKPKKHPQGTQGTCNP